MNNVVFISAHTENNNFSENATQTEHLETSLRALGAKFTPVNGTYKGVSESSFMVEIDDTVNLKTLLGLSLHFNQECIMHIGTHNMAYLIGFNDGRKYTTDIGRIHEIDEREAKYLEASSFIPKTNKYYGVFK